MMNHLNLLKTPQSNAQNGVSLKTNTKKFDENIWVFKALSKLKKGLTALGFLDEEERREMGETMSLHSYALQRSNFEIHWMGLPYRPIFKTKGLRPIIEVLSLGLIIGRPHNTLGPCVIIFPIVMWIMPITEMTFRN